MLFQAVDNGLSRQLGDFQPYARIFLQETIEKQWQEVRCDCRDDAQPEFPDYFPNSFDDIAIDQRYQEPPLSLEATVADWYDRNTPSDDDHYTQPGNLFRHVLTDTERQYLIHNIVASMQGITGPKRDEIIARQLCHFCRADIQLGLGIAAGLGVEVDMLVPQEKVSV